MDNTGSGRTFPASASEDGHMSLPDPSRSQQGGAQSAIPDDWAHQAAETHRPTDDAPNVCPFCTKLGYGSFGTAVAWPCTPYQLASAELKRRGELRPPPA